MVHVISIAPYKSREELTHLPEILWVYILPHKTVPLLIHSFSHLNNCFVFHMRLPGGFLYTDILLNKITFQVILCNQFAGRVILFPVCPVANFEVRGRNPATFNSTQLFLTFGY